MNDMTQLPAAQPVSVTLAMTPELNAMITRGTTYLDVATAYEITDHDTAQQAADELALVKRAIVELKAGKGSFVKPAKEIIASAEKWFDPGIEGYEAAEKLLKQRLLEWDEVEKRRIADERAAREAEERRLRQEAEQQAAAARAKAEQEAAELRRKAEEAEQARLAAEAAGKPDVAARAAATAAKANEKAAAVLENGEVAAQDALIAGAAAVVAAPAPEQQKVNGFATRKNWKAELKPGVNEDDAKALILAAATTRPELLALFDLNQSRLDKWAKAQEAAMNVPGYVARNIPIAAGSKR